MKTFADILALRADQATDSIAYRFWGGTDSGVDQLTYGELYARSRAMADHLRAVCEPGGRVLIMLPPGLLYLVALFGCFIAGVVAVPLYAATSRRRIGRLSDIIIDAGASVIVSDKTNVDRIRTQIQSQHEDQAFRWIVIDGADDVGGTDDDSAASAAAGPDDLALLQYTSGSTGNPKGVMLSHANLVANSALIAQAFGCDRNSRGVIWLPPYHDMGLVGGLMQPLYTGFECTLLSPETFLRRPATWLRAISMFGATHSGGPNFAYELCTERVTDDEIRELDLGAWRVAFNGAETVRPGTLERFAAKFARAGFRTSSFLPCYGLAEATLIVTGGPAEREPAVMCVDGEHLSTTGRVDLVSPELEGGTPQRAMRRLVGSGRLLPGATVVIADDDGVERGEFEVGEIHVAGASIASGYWHGKGREDLQRPFRRTFATWPGQHFLATGDLGFFANGELFITGRKKDLIVIRGRNVFPEDLEATVASSADALRVQPSAAFLAGDEDDRLVIVIELDGRYKADPAQLRPLLMDALGREHGVQPDALVFVRQGTLPLTSSGKVQRWACRKLYEADELIALVERVRGEAMPRAEGPAAPQPEVAGHDAASSELIALITEIGDLHGTPIHADSSITSLGFDSLKVLQLSSWLEERYGVSPGMSELLDDCTVGDLLGMVERASHQGRPHVESPRPHASRGTSSAFPLSPAQQSLWFLHTLSPDSSAYNVSLAFLLSGALSMPRLQMALDRIVARHTTLRTVYRVEDEQVCQTVLDEAPAEMRVVDASGWHADELDEAASAEAAGPFNLRDGPLFRLTAYVNYTGALPAGDVSSGASTVLQIAVHHIAVDFWSLVVLVKELSHLYDALSNESEIRLPALETSYADYASVRAQALRERAAASRAYWRERFSDLPPQLDFPTDGPRPRVQNYVGEALPFRFPVALSARLKALADSEGVTLHVLLLSAFQLLLHRYTGQTDLTIGVPYAGRPKTELHNLIGYFVNPIPVRSTIEPDASFAEHLARSKRAFLRDLAHADYPFAEIVSDVIGRRDPSIHPLYQVMFVFQQSHLNDDRDIAALVLGEAGVEFHGQYLRFESYPIRQRMSAFDFHVSMAQCGDTLIGSVQYNTGLFDRASIERLIASFEHVLDAVSIDRNRAIADVPLLNEAQTAEVIGLGHPAMPRRIEDVTIAELFDRASSRYPDRLAIRHHGESLCYAELKHQSERLAAFLAGRGAADGRPIGIVMERSIDSVVAMLAVLKAGCPYLLFDVHHPFERHLAIARDASVHMLLCTEAHLDRTEALMWSCKSVTSMVCLDRESTRPFEVSYEAAADRDLWDYVAQEASDDIQASGWMNSYTGEYFSREEMGEYVENTLAKLRPYLSSSSRVLEIGCGSGLTMFAVAPSVAFYFGTDLSPDIIEKDRCIARERGLHNITLAAMPAHEVGGIEAGPFDVIVLNSVVQLFSSHQYLRSVLASCARLLADGGTIFIGDVMDSRTKDSLLESLIEFRQTHPDTQFRTKLNWDRELFLSPDVFVGALEELGFDVVANESAKLGLIDNELKRYRFDIALQIVPATRSNTAFARHRGARFWRDDVERGAETFSTHSQRTDAPAYICYTSGTTGTPKGIVVPHRGVVRLVCDSDYVGIAPEDHVAHLSNLAFDAATFEVWGALLNGASLHVFDRYEVLDLHAFLRKLNDSGVSVAFVTTPLFHQAIHVDPKGFAGVSSLLVGGEPMNPELVAKAFDAGGPRRLLNVYGPTENTTFSTWHEVRADRLHEIARRGTIPIGRPINGTTAYVLDEQGRPVPVGVPGELWVGGAGLALEYIGRDALTAERFAMCRPLDGGPTERLYRTGDKVRWNQAGEIEFLGRFDAQVKVRGFRVEPAEIEVAIQRFPHVRDAVVAVESGEGSSVELVAYVVAEPVGASAVEAQSMRDFLAISLPDYMIPARFVAVDAIPLTPSGKLDRRALRALGRDLQATRDRVPPATGTEKAIAKIWSDVLGITLIGRGDNFFEMGGHSLMATQVVSRLRHAFGIDIPLRAMFEEKTLTDLAACVDRLMGDGMSTRADGADAPLEPWRIGSHERAPASFAQQRLWLLDQLYPQSNAYNVPVALRFSGALDIQALRDALSTLIERHEALRTVFDVVDGVPLQRIVSAQRVALPVETLDHLSLDERQATLEKQLTDEAAMPFTLRDGPLIRFRLYRLAADAHVLQLTLHHIVSDGWSMGVLQTELMTLYASFASGQPHQLQPLPIQYADYAVWQRQRLDGERLAALRQYWNEALSGYAGQLSLPYDHPRTGQMLGPGARVPISIDAGDTRRVTELAAQFGTTPFVILMSAFLAVLAHYTRQDDLCVGTPVAGRDARDLEKMIGFFVNTVAIREHVDPQLSFAAFVERMRKTVVDAYSYQEMPFEKIVEAFGAAGGTASSPIFQVMFALQNAPAPELEFDGLSVSLQELPLQTAKFDLFFNLTQEAGRLSGYVEYRADAFRSETVARLAGAFVRQLRGFAADPGASLGAMRTISDDDVELLRSWNDTARAVEAECVHRRIERQAAERPDATALEFGGQRLSYGELNARANALASELKRRGVGPEVAVGVCLARSLELVVALLGIWKAGGAYVPLDPQYPDDRLQYMLTDSGARLLLSGEAQRERLSGMGVEQYGPEAWPRANWALADVTSDAMPDNLAYVIYTSGSTGRPKGAMVSHRGVANRLDWMRNAYRLNASDRFLQKTPYSFDVSVWELFLPLRCGATLVMAEPEAHKDPERLGELIDAHGITVVHFVPSMLSAFVRHASRGSLRSVKHLFCSGEALPLALLAETQRMCDARIHNLYGPTEVSIDVTAWSAPEGGLDGLTSVPIGKPIWNTRTYILDEALNAVPVGVPGELYLGGVGVGRGYVNRPDLTAERFMPDPYAAEEGARMYRTGDLARYTREGEIEYLGRTDHQVKIRGFRIELGEIEAALGACPEISDCVVTDREDIPGDRRLIAYFVVRDGQAVPAPASLRATLLAVLPDHMIPAHFVLLERLPLTANGKLDRKALPAPDVGRGEAEYLAPRTPLEARLAQIWGELLGVDTVGVRDSFFELGGHSLLATQAISRVRAGLDVDLPVRALFECPTVEQFAERVEAVGRQSLTQGEPIVAVPRDAAPVLSFAQQRLWFMEQLETNSAFNNLMTVVRLTGSLDVVAFGKAINEIVRRHEALRTCFATVEGTPLPIIAPTLEIPIPLTDLSELPLAERDARAGWLAQDEAQTPFALAVGPLVRTRLLRLAPTEHIVLLTMHHIISDGWSLGVLVKELAALYGAFVQQLPSPLPELPIQYSDFAHWQRRWLNGPTLHRQLDYWVARLADAPTLLRLPTDRPRPAIQTYRGATLPFVIPAAAVAGLHALGRRYGITLFMSVAAAFNVLLSRYSGQRDICIGTSIANRNRAEIESLIGFFVNALVLRSDIDPRAGFDVLLQQVRSTTLDAYAHQDVSFEQVVDAVKPVRHMSHSPLIQVMLVFQNTPMSRLELPGLTLQAMDSHSGTAKFDMSLFVSEADGGLNCFFEYNTDLFDAATVEQMGRHLCNLIDALVADPHAPVGTLDLLEADERRRLLVEWNDTALERAPLERTLHRLIEESAARTPEAVAVVFGDSALTYGELNARANRLAHYLRERKVGPEVLVGICMERSFEMIVGLLAVLKAGGAYVPLDPTYPAERLAYMLDDAAPAMLFSQQHLLDVLPPAWREKTGRVVCLDADQAAWQDRPATNPDECSGPDNLAYVIYTSGSTGRPKGAMVSHRGAANRLDCMRETYRLNASDRFLQKTPYTFDVSVWEVFLPLRCGATLVMAEPEAHKDPERLGELIDAHGITVVHFVPSMLSAFVRYTSRASLHSVKHLFCSGEALPLALLAEARRMCDARIHNLYGPTEVSIDVTAWSVPEGGLDGLTSVPIGKPIRNTRTYILDEALNAVPVGVPGELYLGGVGVGRGYVNRPDLTAERFMPDPYAAEEGARMYRTGDLARYTREGEIEYLGRTDHQVKIRGFRIELGEIEAALLTQPGVDETVVVADTAHSSGARLIGYVAGASLPSSGELKAGLRELLPDYMVPSVFVALESLPLNTNGKVDRRALPSPDAERIDADAEYVAPSGDRQVRLHAIWCELLGNERIGVRDNFFEAGGHSLLATQLVSRIRDVFDIDLPLRSVFTMPTIEQQAIEMELLEASAHRRDQPIAAVSRANRKRVSTVTNDVSSER
ncbi:non-ribosomal peptide synthetase [Burkholderia multivorans]|uniref:non-ribosomal peptide synthetase n=1 Tax=Burkholderia multivorans TaxID=87883 RepID=UPI0009C02457|nr:non-ribosomal peptide synthetase [Burkholderia multivorans]